MKKFVLPLIVVALLVVFAGQALYAAGDAAGPAGGHMTPRPTGTPCPNCTPQVTCTGMGGMTRTPMMTPWRTRPAMTGTHMSTPMMTPWRTRPAMTGTPWMTPWMTPWRTRPASGHP